MNKKLIFISMFDPESSIAGAVRMQMYSKMLDKEGVDFEFYSFQGNKKFNNRGVGFIKKILKMINVLIFIFNLRKFINNNTDTVFFYYPIGSVFFEIILLLYVKSIKKKKIFLEVNEVLKFGVSEKIDKISMLRYDFLESLSSFYDGIVCISKNIEQYYLNYNKNSLLLPILSDMEQGCINNSFYRGDSSFKIGFTGSIHIEKENLITVFKSLKNVVEKGYDVELNLYGLMYEEVRFKNLIDDFKLGSIVKYHGCIDHDYVFDVLKSQDLLILPRAKNKQNNYGFSTKLAEYLVSGVPVLLTDVSDNLYYLTPNLDCLVADYNSYESFSEKIIFLINNYSVEAPKLSNNAYNKARLNFSYKSHARRLINFLFNRLDHEFN